MNKKARKNLRSGNLADGSQVVEEIDSLMLDVHKYFPRMSFQEDFVSGETPSYNLATIEIRARKLSTRLLTFLQNLDYYAPIWLNLIATGAFILKLLLR